MKTLLERENLRGDGSTDPSEETGYKTNILGKSSRAYLMFLRKEENSPFSVWRFYSRILLVRKEDGGGRDVTRVQ